jgi:glycogen synthase
MRILFLSTEYPPQAGGGGIASYVANVGAALARRGHEVHVLSCKRDQPAADWRDGEIHVHRRGVRRLTRLDRFVWSGKARVRVEVSLSCFRQYRRLGLNVDVVESPDWLAEGFIFALLRSKPHVGHLHTPLLVLAQHNLLPTTWDRRFGDAIERTAMRRADVVTSPSWMLARDLAANGWLGSRSASVVRLPIDVEQWSGLPDAETSGRRVLAVGRLEPRKAPEALVEAAAILAPEIEGLEVVFVGGSNYTREGKPYRQWTEDLARKLAAPCRFIGGAARSAMADWYGSSRVAVLTARYDNFPVAGLEAMAAGRPLVCTSTTGVAELLHGGDGGTVVPPLEPAALAEGLRSYLIDAQHAGRTGRRARDVVARACAPDAIAREREGCYLDAIAEWQMRRGRRFRRPSCLGPPSHSG